MAKKNAERQGEEAAPRRKVQFTKVVPGGGMIGVAYTVVDPSQGVTIEHYGRTVAEDHLATFDQADYREV